MARTVVGTYLRADGTPEVGTLLFSASCAIKSSTVHVLPNPVSVRLVAGVFSISLEATDDVDWSPSGWTWKLTEKIEGGREFYFELPQSDGTNINVTSLSPMLSAPALVSYAGPAGADGTLIRYGTALPEDNDGVTGDFYYRTSTSYLYGPKANGMWPAGVSLIGAAGPTGTGDTGATGDTGDTGATGDTGDTGAAGAAGATTLIDVQKFGPDFANGTTTGANTWTKPTTFTPKTVEIWLCGGGAGGASGRKGAASCTGGAGGSAGELVHTTVLDASVLASTETVTIGGYGLGGDSVTANSTNGNAGQGPGASSFGGGGGILVARAGAASSTSPGTSGYTGSSVAASYNQPGSGGVAGNGTTGSTGGNPTITTVAGGVYGYLVPFGGGGGSGFTNSGGGSNGGDGRQSTGGGTGLGVYGPLPSTRAGINSAGLVDGLAATSMCAASLIPFYTGGGGGASYSSGNAGAGGAGAFGSGGGGGGASRDSVGNSGAGGHGGDGFAVIITRG